MTTGSISTLSNYLLKINKVLPLYITIFIDAISLGIIFPILPHLFINDSFSILANHSINTRNVLLGLILSAFPLAMFFGSSMIGSLSDKLGRKKTLQLSLIGNAVGFILAFLSLHFQSISLLFIGRIISGLFSGSVPVAQAAIIDLTTSDKKAKHLAFSSIANGIGFAVGPALGGMLASSDATNSMPFLFCSVLILVNTIFLYFCFNETYQGNPKQAIHIFTGIKNIYLAFSQKRTRLLSLVFLLYILGYFGFMQYLAIYLAIILKQNPAHIGYFLAYYSLCYVVALAVFFPRTVAAVSLRKILLSVLVLQPIMVFLFILCNNIALSWVLIGFMAIPFSFCYVTLTTMFSNAASSEEQGKMMGIVVSLFAFAWGIIPSITGVLQNITNYLPIFFFIILLIGSLLVAITMAD